MAKVNNRDIYQVKSKPSSEDILFGSDSEKNYKSSNFKISDITETIKEDINIDDLADIPRNTSELVNDGEDGVNKFVDSVGLATSITDAKNDILGITDDKISDSKTDVEGAMKDYVDANNKLLEAQLELQDKALRGELTSVEAQLLLDLENQRREQEKKLDEVSESLTTDIDTLKNRVDKEAQDVKDAVGDLQDRLDNTPTDTDLSDRDIDNLKHLLFTIEGQFNELDFKISAVLRDSFFPIEDKPALEQLSATTRSMYQEIELTLIDAIADGQISQAEKDALNIKLSAFNTQVSVVNRELLEAYDKIAEGKQSDLEKRIQDSIVGIEFQQQFSSDKVTWHDPPFIEGLDVYMRMRNGTSGDWSEAVRIVGEAGEAGKDGVYTDFQFAKNTDLINPPTAGWTDAPPVLDLGDYLWMRSGVVTPPSSEPPYWTSVRLSGPKGEDGLPGRDTVRIDLTNENSSVPATFEGEVLSPIPSTQAIVYEGISTSAGWTFSADFGTATGTIISSTGVVSIAKIVDDSTVITITATKSGYPILTTDYTISKVRAGEPGNGESASVFYLQLSANAIKVNKSNVASPSTISAQVFVRIGANDPVVAPNVTIKYNYDSLAEVTYSNAVTVDKTKSLMTFKAIDAKGVVLDIESVPILKDGADGKDGAAGKDGTDGLQGEKGEDGIPGKTSYTHIAYADSITGAGFSLTDSSKSFIGIYTDFTQSSSTNPSSYTWSKWAGKDGTNGVPGAPGIDGKTPYFHTAWANNITGTSGFSTSVSAGKTHMGTYSDFTQADSTDPTKYKWVLIKGIDGKDGIDGLQGKDGTDGIPGKDGVDGKTQYTHIAYADTASGGGFSQSPTNKAYIGMYVDFVQQDSSTPSDYAWSLIKGADGSNGTPGKAGADGKTPYLHIAYATNSTGTAGFSTTVSAGKTYIGQYTDYVQADSNTPSMYKWSLIKGTDGTNGTDGKNGIDGKTSYTHIAYADTATGGGFSQNSVGKAYVGMYVDFVATDSTDPAKYKWSLIKGADGTQGIPGKAGADGKTPYFHTAWANSENGVTGFSTTVSKDKSFIGTYTDYVQADSTNPASYSWSKIRGDAIVSNTQPTDRYIGMVWIDTSKSPIEQKYWNGTTWILTGVSQSDITQQIKDANDALKNTMDSALKDGIISNNEALAISNNISLLQTNKRILDEQYNVIYNDKLLRAVSKTNLQNKKTDYNTKHTALLNACIAISKKTSVTASEISDYNTKQTAYNTSLSALSKALEECQNEILINGINGIQVGGRNLLLGSNLFVKGAGQSSGMSSEVTSEGYLKLFIANNPNVNVYVANFLQKGGNNFIVNFDIGDQVCFSITYMILEGAAKPSLYGFGTRRYVNPETPFGGNDLNKWITVSSSYVVDDVSRNMLHMGFYNQEGVILIKSIKLENGNKPTPWTPAPEDVQQEIDNAVLNSAQAKSIAEAAGKKVNFLSATVDETTGLISGGALLVGDATGNNAGVVGVTDQGQQSVRFYAGQTYANKRTAPYRVLNDGTLYATKAIIKGVVDMLSGNIGGFSIEDGVITSENGLMKIDTNAGHISWKSNGAEYRIGISTEGFPVNEWYDQNGVRQWYFGPDGPVYENISPEIFYRGDEMCLVTTSTNLTNASMDAFFSAGRKLHIYTIGDPYGPNAEYRVMMRGKYENGKVRTYLYDAGDNSSSSANKEYEGKLFTRQNKRTGVLPNGWYCKALEFDFEYGSDGGPFAVVPVTEIRKVFEMTRYVDGKEVSGSRVNKSVRIEMKNELCADVNGDGCPIPYVIL